MEHTDRATDEHDASRADQSAVHRGTRAVVNRRRLLLTSLAGLFAAPAAVESQPAAQPYRIGILTGSQDAVAALKEALAELGHREGRTFTIERDVEGHFERLPAAVDSLLKVPVDVFVVGGSESVQSVMKATSKIPVVFTSVGDPIEQGFVASYAKPGRNVTGITNMVSELTAKWLEILKEVQPTIAKVAVLWNPPQPAHRGLLTALESAVVSLRLQASPVAVTISEDLEAAFAAIRRERVGGLTMLG